MSDICFIRPANDAAATTLANMAIPLKAKISTSSHTLSADLTGTGATRGAVDVQLAACRAICFFGHGLKSRLQGSSTDLIDSFNVSLASGSIVIAFACWSAHTLGPGAISAGVEAYLGFDEQFGCLAGDPDGEFGAAAISGMEVMLKGNDVGAALREMEKKFDDAFDFYKTGAGAGRSNSVLGWLLANWDKRHLALHGTAGALL